MTNVASEQRLRAEEPSGATGDCCRPSAHQHGPSWTSTYLTCCTGGRGFTSSTPFTVANFCKWLVLLLMSAGNLLWWPAPLLQPVFWTGSRLLLGQTGLVSGLWWLLWFVQMTIESIFSLFNLSREPQEGAWLLGGEPGQPEGVCQDKLGLQEEPGLRTLCPHLQVSPCQSLLTCWHEGFWG